MAALGAEELPLARIARSVVLARDCGVRPSVVLTKADRKQTAEALEADALRVHRLVGEQGDVPDPFGGDQAEEFFYVGE